ncbi:hypothetical protein ABPG77_009984 [Micractinium sp. CCAP 211/92]
MEVGLIQQERILRAAGAPQGLALAATALPPGTLAGGARSGLNGDASLAGLSPQVLQQLWMEQASGHGAGGGAAHNSAGWHPAAPGNVWRQAGEERPSEALAAHAPGPWQSSPVADSSPTSGNLGPQHFWQSQQLQPPPPLPRAAPPHMQPPAPSPAQNRQLPLLEVPLFSQAWETAMLEAGVSEQPGGLPTPAWAQHAAINPRQTESNTTELAQLAHEWQGAAFPVTGPTPALPWQQCQEHGRRRQWADAQPAASSREDPSAYLARALAAAGQARASHGDAASRPQPSQTERTLPPGEAHLQGICRAGPAANQLVARVELPSQRPIQVCEAPQQQAQGCMGHSGLHAASADERDLFFRQQAQLGQQPARHRQLTWHHQQHAQQQHAQQQQHPGVTDPPGQPVQMSGAEACHRLVSQLERLSAPEALAPWPRQHQQQLQGQQSQDVAAARRGRAGPAGAAASTAPAAHAFLAAHRMPSPSPLRWEHGPGELSAFFSQLDPESQRELLQLGEEPLPEDAARQAPAAPRRQQPPAGCSSQQRCGGQPARLPPGVPPPAVQHCYQQQWRQYLENALQPSSAHHDLALLVAQQHARLAELQASSARQPGPLAVQHASAEQHQQQQHPQQGWEQQPLQQPAPQLRRPSDGTAISRPRNSQQPGRQLHLAAASPGVPRGAWAAAGVMPGPQPQQGRQHAPRAQPVQPQLQQQHRLGATPRPPTASASQPISRQPGPATVQPAAAKAAGGGAAAAFGPVGAAAASAPRPPSNALTNRRGISMTSVAGVWAQKAVRADWHNIRQRRHLQAGVALRAGAAGAARRAYRAEAPSDSEEEVEQAAQAGGSWQQQAEQQPEARAPAAQVPAQRMHEQSPLQAPSRPQVRAPEPAQHEPQEHVRRSSRGRVAKRCWNPALPAPTKRRRQAGSAQPPAAAPDRQALGGGLGAHTAMPAGAARAPQHQDADPLGPGSAELRGLATQVAAEASVAGQAAAPARVQQAAAARTSTSPADGCGSARISKVPGPAAGSERNNNDKAPAPARPRGRPRRQPPSAVPGEVAADGHDVQGPGAGSAPVRPATNAGGSGGEEPAGSSHSQCHRTRVILDVMIKSGLLRAPRASGLPAMTSGATQGPRPCGATPDDVQSCMLGPAVRLAVPAPAATASAGSMLAGTSTDDMQRRMGAAGVGAAAQQAVLGALGRVPSSRAAWPSQEQGCHERAQRLPPQLQQQKQQQSGSQVGSLGSGLPEEPSSPEQHAQPTAPPTSSDDQAEAASQPVQPQQAHISTLAAAAPPMRPGQPPGSAGKPRVGRPGGAHAASSKPGKRRSVTAGRKQTPGLAAAAAAGTAAATASPGRAVELAERPLLRPDLPPQPQRRMPEQGLEQQQQQGQQQAETAGEQQQQQQEDAPVELPALPPEAGPRPQQPQADGCRHIAPQQWREYKAALRRWELCKRAREEAEEELLRPRRRRRPPSPDRRPQTMPPVVPGSAAALLREQHEAFAALAEGRRGRGGGLRRAAAMRGAQRISAIASGLVGRRRGVGGCEEEEVEHPADMDSLRASAPHLIQLRSPLHGWGMFAGEPIRRDSFVIEYVGEVVPNAVADRREAQYEAEGLGSMYLFRLDSQRVVDATKAGNCARFINHSCEPNCYTAILVDVRSGERSIGIFAKRDIAAAEELTYHYLVEEEPDGEPMPCHCGARACTGRMN